VLASDDQHVAVVNAIGIGLAPVDQTADITVTRFADFAQLRGLRQDQPLFEGDMLDGGRDGLLVELRCNGGSLIKLSGRFRVALNARRDNQDCAINLFAGVIDVVTDRPTEVNAGGRIMGSAGTRYAVDTRVDNGSQAINLTVFEGAVSLRGLGEPKRIEQMTTVALRSNGAEVVQSEIPAAKLQQHARLLAEFDTVKASAMLRDRGAEIDTAETVQRFTQLNVAVLSSPASVDARLELASAQLRMNLQDEAQYNVTRLGVEQRTFQRVVAATPTRQLLENPEASDARIKRLLQEQRDISRQLDRFRAMHRDLRGEGE